MTTELPSSVQRIAEHLAMQARGYGNHLKWNEKAMMKADLMNVPQRWRTVDPASFGASLRSEGMREEDVAELLDYLTRAQAGRRLIPSRTYRDFRFSPAPDAPEATQVWTAT